MKTKSFTLIELLVVIVIIGILAGVIIVSTSSSIGKANFAKAQAFSNTVQQELLLNLVSEWTFDEGNAQDSWGNNDGTVSGATYQNKASGNCVYGGCYSFDGDDNIDCGSNESLKSLKKVTMSFWIKPFSYSAVDNLQTLGFRTLYGYTFRLYGDNGIPKVFVASMNRIDGVSRYFDLSLSIAPINEFTYLTIFFNAEEGKIIVYKNGSLYGSKAVSTGDIVYTGNFYIGYLLDGIFDDIRVYNDILTISQIKQEYVAGLNSLLANNNISKEEYDQRLNNLAYDKE